MECVPAVQLHTLCRDEISILYFGCPNLVPRKWLTSRSVSFMKYAKLRDRKVRHEQLEACYTSNKNDHAVRLASALAATAAAAGRVEHYPMSCHEQRGKWYAAASAACFAHSLTHSLCCGCGCCCYRASERATDRRHVLRIIVTVGHLTKAGEKPGCCEKINFLMLHCP